MIKLHVDEPAAIPLAVEPSSAVTMTVTEAFIEGGGANIQNNKNATPSTSQVVVTPDAGYDGMAKVTVAAIPPEYIIPSGAKNITANGNNQDVKSYEKVNVNVPNTYSAGDEGKVVSNGALVSQSSATYTENGTYDTTTKNEVVVDVPSGGGHVYTGTIELQNENVDNLIIPVDISNGSAVVVAYVDRTGTIVDGNVVYDDEPIMPASTGANNTMIWYTSAIKQCDNKNMKRDASNYTLTKRPNNMSYCYAYFGNNGTAINLDVSIVSGTNIRLPAMNGTRRWCKSGYYARWAYTVVVA